jgi:hypothetical protein
MAYILKPNKELPTMARKRAPGGGRKPRGEFHGKAATLTTRITAWTREALDRAAEKNDRSLSQEVERRLRDSIRNDLSRDRRPHVRALGEAFMLMILGVERRTGRRWLDDAFTAASIRHGLNFLISHFGPSGTLGLPEKLKDAAAKLPRDLAHHYVEPTQIGLTEAGAVISLLEQRRRNDVFEISKRAKNQGIHVPNEWFAHAQILRELDSDESPEIIKRRSCR